MGHRWAPHLEGTDRKDTGLVTIPLAPPSAKLGGARDPVTQDHRPVEATAHACMRAVHVR